jgi:hypothetical protein
METFQYHQGLVEFAELPASALQGLKAVLPCPDLLEAFLAQHARRVRKHNLVFNYPREQYAKLDRGETPEAINASWLTLSTSSYTNPATQTVSGETLRLAATTKVVDPVNPRNTLLRFILEGGQFVGLWPTAILIGGPDATGTPGTGKIIAAVNNVRDDTNAPLNRDGTTIHLVNWKLKHLDSSEV